MNFNTEASALQEALRVVSRLAPAESGNVTVSSDGKKIFLHAASETARCSVNMPAEVSGKASTFAIGIQALRDATKGRSKLEVEFAKTMCKIKSGAYKAELATVDALEIESAAATEGKKMSVTAEQAAWLKSAVAAVALKPTALISTFMPLAVKLTDKGAFVACYDTDHLAFVNSQEIKGDLEFVLPLDTMTTVLDAFNASAFTLTLSQVGVSVANKLIKVFLALPQEEEGGLTLANVLDTAKASKKAEGRTISLDKAELVAFMDNARAISTKERSEIKFKIEDNKMKVEVSTIQGTTRAVLKTKAKNCAFALDFEFFDEAVRKCKDQVEFKLVTDAFVSIAMPTSTSVISLNQE